jgi:ABC-2 type transport system permease protein
MSWPNVLFANVRKIGIEMRRYLPNTLSLVVTFYAIFLAMFFGIRVIGDPESVAGNIQFLIVGNAFWFLLVLGISSMGWEISGEATRGTLEQLYMSPVPAWQILLTRMVGTLAIQSLIMAAMVGLSMLTAGQWLHLDLPAVLVLMAPTLVSMMGVGYVVAGLALVFKQIQSLLQVLQFVFMGMAFVPIATLPFLEFAPVVKGIDMVRGVLVQGRGLFGFQAFDWLSLVVNALVYLALGVAFYRACERRAFDRGLLGQY